MASADYLNQLRDQIKNRRSKKLPTKFIVSENHTMFIFITTVTLIHILLVGVVFLPILFVENSMYAFILVVIIGFLGGKISDTLLTNLKTNFSAISQGSNSIFLFFYFMKKQNIIVMEHNKLYITYLTGGLTDKVEILEEAVEIQNWMDEHLTSWWIISPDVDPSKSSLIYIFDNKKDSITFKLTYC